MAKGKQQDALFAEVRKREIVELVQKQGMVTVNELCDSFSVSPATIRNDLTELEVLGHLKRTHGGAINNTRTANYELTFSEKEVLNIEAKREIAKEAVKFIHPGDAIAIDTGTTTLELVKLLVDIPGLTVVTNDLRIAAYLEENSDVNVFLLGGGVRRRFHCTVGKTVEDMLNGMFIDTAFVSANGFHPERGLSTPSPEVGSAKRAMMKVAGKVIALVDKSKIGKSTFSYFAGPEDVDIMITDYNADDDCLEQTEKAGIEVIGIG